MHLYSNREVLRETLQDLLVTATSARHSQQRPVRRQNQIRLEYEQAAALAAGYADGQTIKDLAHKYGVHRTTITALLRRFDVAQRLRGLAASDVATAARLYEQGWSLARLGARFGVDPATVWRALQAANVLMRPPSQRGSL